MTNQLTVLVSVPLELEMVKLPGEPGALLASDTYR